MSVPLLPDLAGLRHDARALADRIKLIQEARFKSQDETVSELERADAEHILRIHEPSLRTAAVDLLGRLDVLANAGRGEYVSVPRYWRRQSAA